MKSALIRSIISLSLLVFLFILLRDQIPQITHTLRRIDVGLLVLSTTISLSTILILSFRLKIIFYTKKINLKLHQAVTLTFIGYFFNNFLPTAVGGDIVKAMSATQVTGESVKSISAVVIDRIFGLFTFIMIPSISFLFFVKEIRDPRVPLIIYSCLGAALLAFVVIFSKRFMKSFKFLDALVERFRFFNHIRHLYNELHGFRYHKMVAAKCMLLSILGQSLSIFALYLLAVAIGVQTNMIYFFLLVPIVHLVSMLPSINGLGVREGAYVVFLSSKVGGKVFAASIGVLYLGTLFLFSLIGGLLYFFNPRYHVSFKKRKVSA